MYPENNYTSFLDEIATSGPQVQMIALTDHTGTLKAVIQQPTSTSALSINDVQIFLGWAIAQSYMQIGTLYELDTLNIVTIEYQRGTLLITPIRTDTLIVLADPSASIEFIRQKMPLFAEELRKLESTGEHSAIQPIIPLTDKEKRLMKEHELTDDKKRIEQALKMLDSF